MTDRERRCGAPVGGGPKGGHRLLATVLIDLLTLSRVPLTVAFCALLLADGSLAPCAVLFALIALSDLLDGRLARRLATQSALGAVLDVTADLVFVIAADATLCLLGLLPWWLSGVALLKFAEFVTTSLVARRQRGEGAALWYDRVGRAMAVALYVTPLGALALHVVLRGPVCAAVIDVVCVTIAAVAFVSFVLRVRGVIASSCV